MVHEVRLRALCSTLEVISSFYRFGRTTSMSHDSAYLDLRRAHQATETSEQLGCLSVMAMLGVGVLICGQAREARLPYLLKASRSVRWSLARVEMLMRLAAPLDDQG